MIKKRSEDCKKRYCYEEVSKCTRCIVSRPKCLFNILASFEYWGDTMDIRKHIKHNIIKSTLKSITFQTSLIQFWLTKVMKHGLSTAWHQSTHIHRWGCSSVVLICWAHWHLQQHNGCCLHPGNPGNKIYRNGKRYWTGVNMYLITKCNLFT